MSKIYLYLDLDDTLLDTTNYLLQWHKKPFIFDDVKNCGKRNIHDAINMSHHDTWEALPVEFWETIPWTPWGKEMLKVAEKYFGDEVYLLTSPIPNGVCSMGKQLWVNKNLPKYKNKMIIGHKKYACVQSNGLLIDDSYTHEQKFIERGKRDSFFLFPSYQNNLHPIVGSMYKNPELAVNMIDAVLQKVTKL